MRTLLFSFVFAPALLAQTESSPPAANAELTAAEARAIAALQKSASLADTGFTLRWGPDQKKKKDDDNPFARLAGSAASGDTTGSWHQDHVRIAYAGENGDELLLAGARTLAKDGERDWRLRQGRFADGSPLAFVPNVSLLLVHLAAQDLAVTQRAVGSLDDRPVEIVSATLHAEQVAELVWSGLLPEALVTATGLSRAIRFAAIGGPAAQKRAAPPPPTSTVDVAVFLDPATNLVHQIRFRAWTKADQGGGLGGVMVVQRVGGGAVVEEDDEEEEPEPDAAAKAAPLVYEHGLPVRPRKKTSVCDVVVTLHDHGKVAPPPLTDAQKTLLGR
jgi:hypothetical protein